MALTPDELDRIAARTLAHYDEQALSYWNGTRDHDVSQNVDALLRHIEAPSPYELLDFGCGPGRDLRTFKALGHHATGLEGAANLAALARTNSGCTVLEQNFLALDLPHGRYDGVFANAVLFHVPSRQENFFAYMMQHFDIDGLIEYGVQSLPGTVASIYKALGITAAAGGTRKLIS